MPDIRKQLKLHVSPRGRRDMEEQAPKKTFDFWAVFDRILMETAVHIPVGVAILVSCFGALQYGAFAAAFIPMSFALSLLLSRTYAMAVKSHRFDVAAFLAVLGFGAWCWECYWVHLGAVRFNTDNAAAGLQTFSEEALIAGSIILGLMNLFSRRAYVTGHEKADPDAIARESWWKWGQRRNRFLGRLERAESGEAMARGDGSGLSNEQALAIYRRHNAWPLGFSPSAELLAQAN